MTTTRRTIVSICASLLACILLTSCVSTGSLGLVSSSGADPGDLLTYPHAYREIGPADGRACRFFVLAIIPFGNSTISRALSKALQESGGDALLNVTISSSLYGFVPIYNVLSFTCTTIQGTAIEFEAIQDEPQE